jgi:hypothetical protein
MNAKSGGWKSVLTGIGMMPALIAPRNAAGKSIVSSRPSTTRCSGSSPNARSAPAQRSTRAASSPYVHEPYSSTNAVFAARAGRLRSSRSTAAL